jgi:hypothetical protein
MNWKALTGKVITAPDAWAVYDEFKALNLRKLRMGIPLPRWTGCLRGWHPCTAWGRAS